MSDGTADQFNLALRLASVDQYFWRALALSFVAYDLLINFDDPCAAAEFKVPVELGQMTNFPLITRHQHLVVIVCATLGRGVNVISSADDRIASNA